MVVLQRLDERLDDFRRSEKLTRRKGDYDIIANPACLHGTITMPCIV